MWDGIVHVLRLVPWLGAALLILAVACGGDASAPVVSTPAPSTPTPIPAPTPTAAPEAGSGIAPFTNTAPTALTDGYEISNYRPSAVVFDYDEDGDQDLFITSNRGHANFLYSNRGDGTFDNVSVQAGVALTDNNSSGAAACDLNNDGYKDLYVGARGIIGDRLDFRSADDDLRTAIGDHLLINNGDGAFTGHHRNGNRRRGELSLGLQRRMRRRGRRRLAGHIRRQLHR